ncbi:echinoderm microtubule-associated protein-like 5 [Penaeus japonicus]|uniref:echinoderm microtubule-associated protein-like 5 n=1 Tax=Penaeus japonicus TaxID=27405 RepID=UPI001C713BD7|nr:echinoderm microtubule-associated protein-like 5 [Penaeus japonicus]
MSRHAPDGSLELQWVFGYNGHTARNNVKVNSAGHLVYYVAGVGVVHDIGQKKQAFYTGHNDDITSLTMSADGKLVATGQMGKDAYITVWDSFTCQPVSVIHDGHSHAVTSLAFSSDGSMLASVGGPDRKQELMVWLWEKGRRMARKVAYNGKVEEVEWEPGSTTKLVTCGKRHVRFWKLRGNVLQSTSGVFGSEGTADQVSVTHMADGRVITGSDSGHLYVWVNAKLDSVIRDIHPGGVLVTEVYPNGLLTGGRDGSISMFDNDFNKVATVPEAPSLVYDVAGPIHSLAVFNDMVIAGTEKNEIWTVRAQDNGGFSAACIVQGHGLGEVWGLATHPAKPVAATASDDFTVRLWDLEEHRPLTTATMDVEARSVAFSPDGQHLAVGLTKGIFIILDAEHLEEQFRVSDRKEVRHDLKYSPSGEFLAVASNDNFVSAIVSGLDEAIVSESSIPSVGWSTWTGALGPQVAGLWHKYADVSDINAADANFYYNVIVTGDDFGLVKLFRFPCPKRGAKSRSFVGHSAHVTNIRWTNDSEYVVSVGGADHAVFLWRFRPSRNASPRMDFVRLPSTVEGESDDDVLDTEDELEGIPELTIDLEEELAGSTRSSGRRSRRRMDDVTPGVDVATDSTFAKRRNATDVNEKVNVAPIHALSMSHVFGFRAHECRNNAHWLKDGRVVYHVAAVGIVCDPQTLRQEHYLHHTDDILCLAVHPGGELVASGQIGREATVHVWDAIDHRILSLLQGGHTRGVSAVDFSSDGERLASLGLDDYHTLVVWNWRKGYKLANARGHSDKIFGLKFSPSNSHRLMTFGVKHVKVWNHVGGGLTHRQVSLGRKLKQETALCCAVGGGAGSDEWWVVGLSSGTVIVVRDLKVERVVKAHKAPVYAILETNENIWTAGQGGYVCKWDREFNKCLKVFPVSDHFLAETAAVAFTSAQPGLRSLSAAPGTNSPILVATQHAELLLMDEEGQLNIIVQGHGKGEVWGLDTHPRLMEAVTVGDDNTLRRWGLEDHLALGSVNLRKAARCVHFHPTAMFVALGYLDGGVSLYLYPSLKKHGGAQHRTEGISEVKFSPDGRFLAVGSHECLVDLYVVDTDGDTVSKEGSGLRRVGVCRGASSWITQLTWHKDSRLLQANTGAGEQLFFEAPHGNRQLIPDATSCFLDWSFPLTCVLDKTVEGVWARSMDLTDINAIATANALPLVVTASDDGGLVRLFRYPCQGGFKKHRQYTGHSAHVTNVKWTFDDSTIVTTGGADTSVIVWHVRKVEFAEEKQDEEDGEEATKRLPALAFSDLPEEEITMMDLEAAGLEDSAVLTPSATGQDSVKEPVGRKGGPTRATRTAKGIKRHLERLRSIPTLTGDDKTVFYCNDCVVGKLELEGDEVTGQSIGYKEHETHITTMAISKTEPVMVATAQLSLESEEGAACDTEAALIHVWRPLDGANVGVLRGGSEGVITSLSFSPSGRFLASLADGSVVHIFNWIKGAHVASTELKVGMATSVMHSGEATLAVLTPRAVLFLDLVGNSLVTTRGQAPPDLLPDGSAFSGIGVSFSGRVYVGTSDGSVVEWTGRIATRYVSPPDDPPTLAPIRLAIAAGQGVVFTACRLDSVVVVRCYTTDTPKLTFFSDSLIEAPTEDWTPTSARLGAEMLIIGARMKQPFIVLDLKSGKFTTIEYG